MTQLAISDHRMPVKCELKVWTSRIKLMSSYKLPVDDSTRLPAATMTIAKPLGQKHREDGRAQGSLSVIVFCKNETRLRLREILCRLPLSVCVCLSGYLSMRLAQIVYKLLSGGSVF